MKNVPVISVVVPVRNGADTIADCVQSLLRTEFPTVDREIVVVDNGSTDATAEIVQRFPVTYLSESKRGAPCARNKGIRASRGRFVAFCDADCLVTRNWLNELLAAFQQPNTGAVAGEIVAAPPVTPAQRYAARVRHLAPQKYLQRPLLPFAVFANLAFTRDTFDHIGLLDENLFQGDSTDFCTRFLRETGLQMNYAPKAIVFHRHRDTAWSFVRQQYAYGRGHALLYSKYRNEVTWGFENARTAYRDLARSGWHLVRHIAPWQSGRSSNDEFYYLYFEFLKKMAERIGFARQTFLHRIGL